MKLFVLICALGVVIVVCHAQILTNIPSSQVSALLSNPNYVRRQIDCVIGRGSCDADGIQIRGKHLSIVITIFFNVIKCKIILQMF